MPLKEEFARLRCEFMPAPFWFWNDEMSPTELRRQIGEMHARNMGGFYMHARMGRVTPYMSERWMECIRACVDEAAQLGMGAWIYDEDGWPSGFGGGAVNGLGEDYLQKYALAHQIAIDPSQETIDLPVMDGILAVFTAEQSDGRFTRVAPVDPDRLTDGRLAIKGLNSGTIICFSKELHRYRRFFCPECYADGYVDILDPKVVAAFIEKIYEAYKDQIGRYFGTVVPGVFTDEPSYHELDWNKNDVRLPWSDVLSDAFLARYGRPLTDVLPDIAYGLGDHFRARWCYYSCLAELFAKNYSRPLAEWCRKHDLVFTGHYILEESPRAATQTIGDPFQHYRYQQAPGIDHLGKNLDLFEFWTSSRVLVKQAATVAHQLGKERVLCETFAGGGWDFGILEQKWMGDWMYALGVNLLCQHAFHYTLRGYRKRDYPPSLSFQQPWWQLSADLGAHFSRLGYVLTRGLRQVNVLVLHPLESFFATHDVAGHPWPNDVLNEALKAVVQHLLAHQIDFDFGNEALMAEFGRIEGQQLLIGRGRYDVVIIPHSLTWRSSTVALLEQFVGAGGKTFSIEPYPEHVDAVESSRIVKLVARTVKLGRWDAPGFERTLTERVSAAADPPIILESLDGLHREVVAMHRVDGDTHIFFLASGAKESFEVTARLRAPGTPEIWNSAAGQSCSIPHVRTGDVCQLRLSFCYGTSFLIVFAPEAQVRAAEQHPTRKMALCGHGDELDYHLDCPNALILDRGRLILDGQPTDLIPTIEAGQRIAHAAHGTPGKLIFEFHSDQPIREATLLGETPERFNVSFNGRSVPPASRAGWFIDTAFRKIALPGGLRRGMNRLEVSFRCDQGLEIEPFYVLGRFGVYHAGGTCRVCELPSRLRVGSWVDQGLCFYAGSVTYQLQCDIPDKAGRVWLTCDSFRSALRVVVNGCNCGTMLWPPYQLEISDHAHAGSNRIDLVVANSLRNFLGPHHVAGEDDIQCIGPHTFFERKRWVQEYRFKPAGLLGAVTLRWQQ